MILRDDLLKKVKLIEITTKKVVNDVLTGRYKSHFKGQGVQFSEHRQYVPGDDVRHIDWKVSARTRDPLIKKFEEERELSVLLLIDLSASGVFGSQKASKFEVLAETSGILAHAANQTGDKVGAIFFSHQVDQVIPLRKGRAHVHRLIRQIFTLQPHGGGTDLAGALETANRVLKHSGIVFILSDFLCEDYEMPLRRLARKHDVIALRVTDPREERLPTEGYIWVQNPETGHEALVDTESAAFQKWFSDWRTTRSRRMKELFRRTRIEEVLLGTDGSHADVIVRYFQARSQKKVLSPARDEKEKETAAALSPGSPESSSLLARLRSVIPWGILLLVVSGLLWVRPSRAETDSNQNQIKSSSAPSSRSSSVAEIDALPLVDIGYAQKPNRPLRIGDILDVQLDGFPFLPGMRIALFDEASRAEVPAFVIVTSSLHVNAAQANQARFQLGIVREGELQVPSLGILSEEGQWVARTSPWVLPPVLSVLSEEDQKPEAQPSPAPPRPPRALDLPFVWKAILASLLLGLLFWLFRIVVNFYRRRQKQGSALALVSQPRLPEDEEALAALQVYRGRDWFELKTKRELYFAVSDTLKRYSGRRWSFDALEATSGEFLAGLGEQNRVDPTQLESVRSLMERLDRVKFADQVPTGDEPGQVLREAESFVLATRKRPLPNESISGGGN